MNILKYMLEGLGLLHPLSLIGFNKLGRVAAL
jgi:hypothetical protein